ncbi:C1QL [Mytilus edulis]|uniref:C1QL n=1 Tax=Mytilus edulis TaxID=6550 RepID=A0A8S3SQG5_MYTED|nr:C1QL [Mytilus edulis]
MVGRIWLFLLPAAFGFLFELNTPGSVNGGLTSNHYNALLDIITEERKERKQMEQYIRQLEMEKNYEHVRSELEKVQSKPAECRNLTERQTNTTYMAKVVEITQNQVNMLLAHEKARKEDFLALYNLTLNNQNTMTRVNTDAQFREKELRINMEERYHNLSAALGIMENKIKSNLTLTNQNTMARVNTDAQFREKELRKYTDERYHNLSVVFGIMENKIKSDLMFLQDKLTKESEQVAVTACATSGLYNRNSVVRFPNIKTSYGNNSFSTLESNGKFTCSTPGLYFIVASMMTNVPNSEYQIRKNGDSLVYVRIVPNVSNDPRGQYHTGTGSAVVFLDFHDTIDIHTVTGIDIHPGYSCVSLFKIH